ncbi:MAG: hypothetical protein AAB552_02585 [Patescibacteria group bacterium]
MKNFFKTIIGTFIGAIFLLGGALAVEASNHETAQPSFVPTESEGVLDFGKFNLNCGISINPSSKANITDCFPLAVYYFIYKPTGYLLTGSAYIFDALFPLSISSQFINQPFIEDGVDGAPGAWTIVRDFANLAFIFILLYIGISIMFVGGDWKGPVLNVVIIALFMNFSLFFTKVIIDTGNIFAVGIYNQMGTQSMTPHTDQGVTGISERGLSYALATHFQPQKFMSATQAANAGPMEAIFVFIIAAIVSTYVAFVFLKVAFMMVGRLLMFWYLMIASPIAFLSWATPHFSGYFGSWFKDLTRQTFFPVVFLFFLYIIISVLNSGILDSMVPDTSANGMVDAIIIIVLKTVIIVVAIQKALSASEHMAGEAGKMASSYGMKALGLAAGGGAGALRLGLGGGAHLLNKSGVLQRIAKNEQGNWASRMGGRAGVALTDAVRTGSLDFRNIGLVQKAMNLGKVDIGKPEKPKKGELGGFSGAVKKWTDTQTKADTEKAEAYKLTDAEKYKMEQDQKENDGLVKVQQDILDEVKKANTLAKENLEKAGKMDEYSDEKRAYAMAEKAHKEAKKAYEDAATAQKKDPTLDISVHKTKLEDAEKVRDSAKNAHEKSPTHLAFKDATKILDRIKELEKEADGELFKAQEKIKIEKKDKYAFDAKGRINIENQRRANMTADRIESGLSQIVRNIAHPITYSHKAAKTAADKIRFNETEPGRKKTADGKDTAKWLKKFAEESKKGEEKPEKPKEPKPDADDHH